MSVKPGGSLQHPPRNISIAPPNKPLPSPEHPLTHMRNNSTRQKGKKNSTSQFQSFEHNGMKIYDQQRLESREEKKAAHTQKWCPRIWKLYSKRRPVDKLTRYGPPTYKDPASQHTGRATTVTTLRLEKCAFRHALAAHTFCTSPLMKCQIT